MADGKARAAAAIAVVACVGALVAATAAGSPAGSSVKVVLIGNQRFGDLGPMDDMARGLARCGKTFGFETKKIESISPAGYEDDIRAMAQAGYQLIFTTFPPMTPATKTVAKAFPKTDFAGVYQFINMAKTVAPNIWDTEYKAEGANYILGAVGATLSKTKKLGYVLGDQDPTLNSGYWAFVAGAKAVNPRVSVDFAIAGSFEDPAKGKEIAKAMTSRGIDFIQTAAAKTQLGVIDGAKEGKALFSGDVADNSKLYPQGFVGYTGTSFGQNIFLGCKYYKDNKLPLGKHTYMDLSNGAMWVPYDALAKWGGVTHRTAEANRAVALEKRLDAAIVGGKIKLAAKPAAPKAVRPG